MGRDIDRGPDWIEQELERLAKLRGEARLAGTWDLAERAGVAGDVESKISLLGNLMQVALDEGRYDYKLRGFGELKRIYLNDARYADLRGRVLWYYKWIVNDLFRHIDVPRETIEDVFRDMAEFYEQEGESPRPVYSARCQACIWMGMKDDATEWFEKWRAEPKGDSDDCPACDVANQVIYHVDREEWDAALKVAEPVLTGEAWCEETPETLVRLFGAAVKAEDQTLALKLLHFGEPRVRRGARMLAGLAMSMIAELMIGQLTRARRLALVGMRRALECRCDLDRFALYRAGAIWASLSVILTTGDQPFPARLLPAGSTLRQPGVTQVKLTDLADACFKEASDLARRFDARNRTDRFAKRIEEAETMIRIAVTRLHPR